MVERLTDAELARLLAWAEDPRVSLDLVATALRELVALRSRRQDTCRLAARVRRQRRELRRVTRAIGTLRLAASEAWQVATGDLRARLAAALVRSESPQHRQAEDELVALRADLRAAAGELLVPIPEPGTDAARLLLANRLLIGERDALRAEIEARRVENARVWHAVTSGPHRDVVCGIAAALAAAGYGEPGARLDEVVRALLAERDALLDTLRRISDAGYASHTESDDLEVAFPAMCRLANEALEPESRAARARERAAMERVVEAARLRVECLDDPGLRGSYDAAFYGAQERLARAERAERNAIAALDAAAATEET